MPYIHNNTQNLPAYMHSTARQVTNM